MLLACVAPLISSCDELDPSPEVTVTAFEEAPWRQVMSVTETDTFGLALRGASGKRLAAVRVLWESTDSTVLQVSALKPESPAQLRDSLDAGTRAAIVALRRGAAEIIATVVSPGLERAQDRRTVITDS